MSNSKRKRDEADISDPRRVAWITVAALPLPGFVDSRAERQDLEQARAEAWPKRRSTTRSRRLPELKQLEQPSF